jgi:hypothetical protein
MGFVDFTVFSPETRFHRLKLEESKYWKKKKVEEGPNGVPLTYDIA